MRPFGHMGLFVIIFAMAAIVVHFLSGIKGFPDEVMLILWPAEYVWLHLQAEVGSGFIKTILSNVAVFGLLGGVQGGIVGILVDFYKIYRRAALRRRVEYLPYSKDTMDLAFRRRVLEVLVKYDPAGLISSGSTGESYRPEAELILANLKNQDSAKDLQRFCRRHFKRHFSRETAHAFGKYDSLAGDIWTEYQRLRSSPRRLPPTSTGL